MTAQETTLLPNRVARSARNLARASLAGVARELQDPRMAKQVGSSSQTTAVPRHDDGSRSDEILKSMPALYARENSFRSQANASALRAVEENFDWFQRRHVDPSEWLSTCPKMSPESERFREGSYKVQDEPHESYYHASEAAAKDGANDAINSKSSGPNTSAVSDIKHDSKAKHAREAAARRLEQIGAQIQRNLSMQQALQQQNAGDQAWLLSTTTAMDLNHESTQQDSDQQPRTSESSHIESTSDSHQTLHQHGRQTPYFNRDSSSLVENEKGKHDFHCPYYACQHNLKLFLSSSLSASRKMCVHTGCNKQMETQDAWSQHIAMPHHEIQG